MKLKKADNSKRPSFFIYEGKLSLVFFTKSLWNISSLIPAQSSAFVHLKRQRNFRHKEMFSIREIDTIYSVASLPLLPKAGLSSIINFLTP
ncbi:MAG: hypothetical protein JSS98_01035 [Bacteroidetes bacterium]|nr:hypothetical protein [Bacteroidota bacterium]